MDQDKTGNNGASSAKNAINFTSTLQIWIWSIVFMLQPFRTTFSVFYDSFAYIITCWAFLSNHTRRGSHSFVKSFINCSLAGCSFSSFSALNVLIDVHSKPKSKTVLKTFENQSIILFLDQWSNIKNILYLLYPSNSDIR